MVHHLITPVVEKTDIINCHYSKKSISLVEHLVEEVCHLHRQLDELDSLVPCAHVNALFTKLVHLCTFHYDDNTVHQVLSDPRITAILPHIRSLASRGEYELELFWARLLVQDDQPHLARFVYYQNYVDLVKLEVHALLGAGAALNTLVFIGSGPLPLSSILMCSKAMTVHNIDRDQASIQVSAQLLEKLGLHERCTQHIMDASQYAGFDQADVVVLGALVGSNVEEKIQFLTGIGNAMKRGSFVMVRSAHSLRKLLYPSIEPHLVNMCGFETVVVLHPYNDVVNSVLIAKKI